MPGCLCLLNNRLWRLPLVCVNRHARSSSQLEKGLLPLVGLALVATLSAVQESKPMSIPAKTDYTSTTAAKEHS